MPRSWDSIHGVYIADGFSDDCDEIIQRCANIDTLTYSTFCNIWKDMNFAGVFQGRQSGAEIAEVSEEFLQVAKSYMVANTGNFEETVAGLFLVYGLLNLQPFSGFAALRITPEDVPAIKRIERTAREERRHDVLYILGDVLLRGPCQFHIMARERGMEGCITKYFNAWTTISGAGVLPRGVFFRKNEEMDIIKEINNVSKKYTEAKLAITEGVTKDPSLFYVNENFPKELDSSLKKVLNGVLEDDATEDAGSLRPAVAERLDRVQSIKSKAMRNTVDRMRHLTSVVAKEQNSSQKPHQRKKEKKENLVKTGIEPKPSTSKRIASPVKAPLERKKQKVAVSSSSESDSNDDDAERITKEIEADINLDQFKKPWAVEIEIDNVPVFTTGVTNNKEYTIEIIDQLEQKKETMVKGVEEKETIERELNKGRRKKSAMQSRYKRIGMLSVANFEEEPRKRKEF